MQDGGFDGGAPRLPFTLTAGDAPMRVEPGLRRRRRWLLIGVVAYGALGFVLARDLRALILPAGFLAFFLLLLWGDRVYRRAYRRATITVTTTSLEIRGVRQCKVLERDEMAAMVVGWFTTQPDPAGIQVAFVDREGRRRHTVQLQMWPEEGLAQVASALEVPLRRQDAADKRLIPFYLRHMLLSATAGALVLVVGIVGAIVVVDHVQAGNRTDDAVSARRDFRRYAGTRLTGSQVPGVQRSTARSSVIDGHVHLFLEVDLTTAGGEADPAAVRAVRTAVCAFAPDIGATLEVDARVTTTLTSAPADEAGDQPRRVLELDCTLPRATTDGLLAWFDHAAAEPVGPRISDVITESDFNDVDLSVFLATRDDDGFTAAADQVCSFELPSEKTVAASFYGPHFGGAQPIELDCAHRAGMLAAWQRTAR